MESLRKALKKFTVFFIVCSLMSTYVYGFSDVDLSSIEGKAITKMQQSGYIQGYEDGTFRPNATLTRGEFVTIVNKMYNYTVPAENVFTDIKESDWYYNAVLCGVQAGYIKGHDDKTFRPNDTVTREQVCVMINRILNVAEIPFGQEIKDPVSDWARDSVEKLIANRFFTLEEGGRFRGTQAITRAEVCCALEKCIVEVSVEIEPIDLESLARDELERRLKDIISVMEKTIIPGCTYEGTIEVANRVNESMKKYLSDPEYDYIADAKATYNVYKTLGYTKAGELKGLIYEHVKTEDIAILFDFFYVPEIDENK